MKIQTLGLGGFQPAEAAAIRGEQIKHAPSTSRARLTSDYPSMIGSAFEVLMPFLPDEIFRGGKLDPSALDRLPLDKLLEVLIDVSPELSRGLWDFLRMGNPGWECEVHAPGNRDEESPQGRTLVNDFLDRLERQYGSVDVVINRFFLAVYLRGAFVGEVVLGPDGRSPVDLVAPDPSLFRFRRVNDPLRGDIWELIQYTSGVVKSLNVPTVKYLPVDPFPGVPYGRSPLQPAVFASVFLLTVLHDLRRVIAQQGYPRLDIEVKLEMLTSLLSRDVTSDPDKMKKVVDDVISQITSSYAALQPDDAFVHTDVSKLNQAVGTLNDQAMGGIDAVIQAIERMLTRALKTMPLLMGIHAATSEANANRQWEIHAAGIKAVQHLVENGLQSLLNALLEANGIRAQVEWRFAELRAAEMLRDAQTEALRIQNEITKYVQGWTSQEAGSLEITGALPDQPEPRKPVNPPPTVVASPGQVNPEPGANRARRSIEAAALLATAATGEPSPRDVDAAEEWWKETVDPIAVELLSASVEEE